MAFFVKSKQMLRFDGKNLTFDFWQFFSRKFLCYLAKSKQTLWFDGNNPTFSFWQFFSWKFLGYLLKLRFDGKNECFVVNYETLWLICKHCDMMTNDDHNYEKFLCVGYFFKFYCFCNTICPWLPFCIGLCDFTHVEI